MKEATTKANGEHKEFEQQLKKRRKEFGELLDKYASEVESYHTKSEIIKRDQMSAEVTELADQLKAAQQEAEYINAQEKMFGWATTKYGNVGKVSAARNGGEVPRAGGARRTSGLDADARVVLMCAQMVTTLEPYVILWNTVSQFFDKFSTWMNGPFYKLVPEDVEGETGDAFRRLYKLTKVLSGQSGSEPRPGPLAVAEEGKAKVAAFQDHLPLIAAICNPGLRDRHWQVRAVAGVRSVDAQA